MLLVLDNYDSFTYNLVHILRDLGVPLEVYRNDALSLDDVARYEGVVLSPGPGIPEEAGMMMDLIRRYAPEKPMLGVCLGHQAIGEAFGATLYNLPDVLHGVATPMNVLDTEDALFAGIPARFEVARYHSWAVSKDQFPAALQVLAEDDAGEILAMRHRELPVFGVQFHPESIITEHGVALIQNWLQFLPVSVA